MCANRVVALLLLAGSGAWAQTTVNFANRVGTSLRAPVYGIEERCRSGNPPAGIPPGSEAYTGPLLSGTGYTAALFAGAAGSTEAELGQVATATFGTITSAGYFNGGLVPIPQVPAGSLAVLQVRVWENHAGSVQTWGEVLANPTILRRVSEIGTAQQSGLTPVNLSFLRSFNLCPPEGFPPADTNTLLLLDFDDNLAGAAGETPTQSSGITFESGVASGTGNAARLTNGSRLFYPASGNINAASGTVEFWIKPNWNGNQSQNHRFFEVGQAFNNGMLLGIDAANNLRFIQWGDDPLTANVEVAVERGVGASGAAWVAQQWYHVAATWNGATRQLAFYVNGHSVGTAANAVSNVLFSGTSLAIGSDLGGGTPGNAAFDEFRIWDRPRTAAEVLNSYLAGLGLLDTNPPAIPANFAATLRPVGVQLDWTPSPSADVSGYELFRRPFGGGYPAQPLAVLNGSNAMSYLDTSVFGGQAYFYRLAAFDASTNRSAFTPEISVSVPSVTDLDVSFIERTARDTFRYVVDYPNDVPTLRPGTESEKRWPALGEQVVFVAHVLSRGTVPLSSVNYRWRVNGAVAGAGTLSNVPPNQDVTASLVWTWNSPYPDTNHADQTVTFEIDPDQLTADPARQNNTLTDFLEGMALAIYVQPQIYEAFATRTNLAGTLGFEDWIQAQFREMNAVFARSVYPLAPAGCFERVRVDRIVVGDPPNPDDGTADGRWHFSGDAGYADVFAGRIDGGLLHELMHQLGVIDLYQVQAGLEQNGVSTPDDAPLQMENIFARGGLMGGGDITPHFPDGGVIYLSEHDAAALNRHCGYRRGYYGEYLFDVPQQIDLQVLDSAGGPAAGASVRVFQTQSGTLRNLPVAAGVTDSQGRFTLPNRAPNGVVTTATGHTLRPNAFGSIHVVGVNGVMLFEVSRPGGDFDYAWLNLTDANRAYWAGQTSLWTLPIQSRLASAGLPRVAVMRSSVEGTRAALQWAATPGAAAYRVYRASRFHNRPEDPAHQFENWILRPLATVSGASYTDIGLFESSVYAVAAVDGAGREGPLSGRVFAPLLQNPWAVVVQTNNLRTVLDPQNGYALLRQLPGGSYFSTVGSVHYHLEFSRFMALDVGLGRLVLSHPADFYTTRHSVRVADLNGNALLEFGDTGAANGQFNTPAGVAVDAEHRIYVVDGGNNRVEVFTSAGGFLTTFGGAGGGPGQFNSAQGIAVDAAHRVYVCDRGNARVQVLQFDGSALRYDGTLNRAFTAPVGVTVGLGGRIYVTDSGASRVEEFSPDGQWLRSFTTPEAPAIGPLHQPTGLAQDASGALVVCDTGNRRVVTIRLPGLPPTLAITRPAAEDAPVTVTMQTAPGLPLRLDISPDFKTWTPLATIPSPASTETYLDPVPPLATNRFYRATILP